MLALAHAAATAARSKSAGRKMRRIQPAGGGALRQRRDVSAPLTGLRLLRRMAPWMRDLQQC